MRRLLVVGQAVSTPRLIESRHTYLLVVPLCLYTWRAVMLQASLDVYILGEVSCFKQVSLSSVLSSPDLCCLLLRYACTNTAGESWEGDVSETCSKPHQVWTPGSCLASQVSSQLQMSALWSAGLVCTCFVRLHLQATAFWAPLDLLTNVCLCVGTRGVMRCGACGQV